MTLFSYFYQMKKKLLLLLTLLSLTCTAQFSKTHYIPPLSSSIFVVPEEQFLYISTPNITPVSFRIINLGGTVVNGTVSRDTPYVYSIGVGESTQLNVRKSQVMSVMSNKGFIVEAEDLIYVSARVTAGGGNQAGEVVSKGLAALGTQFRIGALLNQLVPEYGQSHYTFISILATENNTTVQFNDIEDGVQLINDLSGDNPPLPVVLNSGESYVVAVEGPTLANKDGLVGALVSSDKPIAVNCGSFGGTNGEMGNLDLGFDQIVSAERTGKDFIFIRSTGMNNVERILLIAHEDNTEIFLSDSTTPLATLNAGEFVALNGNKFTPAGNLYVRTSKNVFAYQSIGDDIRPDQANQEMFFVPPLSCETPRIIDNIPFMNLIGTRLFTGRVTIVTEAAATLSFTIDGVSYPLASLPSSVVVNGPTAVLGNSDYETYTLTGLGGNVSVYSTGQLYLASYGSSDAATFGGFYSGFTFKPEIAFDKLDATQPNCLPNVVLSVSPLTAFDNFQWFFNDNPIAGATTNTFTPTLPGYYQVSATIVACGTTLLSDKIPVSSCATNVDHDLVIDNIDADNDNDGITNCTESYGNILINLSNPLAGNINVGAYSNSFSGSFPAATGPPAATPFIGASGGNFISEVTPGKGNSVIYKVNFSQPLSISMDYTVSASAPNLLTSDSEILISVPVNQTITVLNPTNQLLIDTNYDGIYESGVTEFSSFELRFRLNSATPLASGAGTFSFRSNLVNAFTFTQRNLRDDIGARASFRLSATCLPKDSDLDNVPDQFDYDSDNDGIPDLHESQGTGFLPLSGADTNTDGLDNIFGVGISPADSDNDTIADYLDLDSDNNGIYDLVEAGSNAPDSNANGIIDGNASSFGSNGLANSIETTAGSNVIGYTLSDTDADGIFNYLETDNDNDLCNDVREAGFSDANNDGYLGNAAPPTVNSSGIVTGAGGYTVPNPDYSNPTPIVISAEPQDIITCELQNAVFSVGTNPGVTYQWQISTDGISFANITNNAIYSGATTATLTVAGVIPAMDGNTFRVLLNKTGNVCGHTSGEAVLSIDALPPSVTLTLVQCETGNPPDGITLFDLSQVLGSLTGNDPNLSADFFTSLSDAENNVNPLPLEYPNISDPQQLTVKITNTDTGCFSYSILNLSVNNLPNGTINMPEACDTDGNEDGFFAFDLNSAGVTVGFGQTISYYETENDALLEENSIVDPSAYINLVPYALQTVYARVENTLGCAAITRINIKVNALPDIDANLALENHVVCVNSTVFTTILDAALLDGSSPTDYTYQWYFQGVAIPGATAYTLSVSMEGTYTVEVNNSDGCSKIRTIPVIASSTALVEYITISDLSENNTITVVLTSNSYGDYIYSLDYPNAFQQSNTFYDVAPGIHTVFIKDVNGCPIASDEIAVLGIPNYFTPNGDGFHDTWNVKGISSKFYPETEVRIFDRYGKLLKQIGAAGTGWDGTFNGISLPSDDYWYVVQFADGRILKGHFSLKR